MAIRSFSDDAVEGFFRDGVVPSGAGWAAVAKVAKRKLDMLNYAEDLMDLASPPGNRLEALKGDRVGYHCIRVNQQWRIVFRWTGSGPSEIRILDYH